MSTGSSFSYAVIVFICNSSQTSISTPDLFQEFPVAYFLTPPGCLTNRSEWNYLHSPNSCQPIPPLVLPFNHKWFHDPILLSYLCQISSWDTSLSINYNQIDTTLLLISTIHNLSLSLLLGERATLTPFHPWVTALLGHTPFSPTPKVATYKCTGCAHTNWLARGATFGPTCGTSNISLLIGPLRRQAFCWFAARHYICQQGPPL